LNRVSVRTYARSHPTGAGPMEMFFPRRKLCLACGKPMALVPASGGEPREKYRLFGFSC
jgi:hypothetical protein